MQIKKKHWLLLTSALFNSLYNMRDLGGYSTTNSTQTVYGKLIRSDCPNFFSEDDIKELKKLNITQVIDLRTKKEEIRKVSAFKQLKDIEYHQISFASGDIAPEKESEIPISYLEMYEDFLTIKKVLDIISTNRNGITLFHCAVGKDRTGIISSILLKICDVCRKDILRDYEISYTYLKPVIDSLHKNNPNLPEWLGQSKLEYLDEAMILLEKKLGFKFDNFSSYKDENTLSMIASNISEYKENAFEVRDMELLKFIALYGKNSSGKSNIFKALGFMKNFIFNTTKMDSTSEIDINSFKLNSEAQGRATCFEVAFIIENTIYKYGFKIFNNEVQEEWLEQNKKRFTTLFERNSPEGEDITIGNSFKEGKNVPKNQVRRNGLFLPIVAVFNGEVANKILKWFKDINIVSGERIFSETTISLSQKEEYKNKISNFLKIADLGINGYDIKEEDVNDLPEELAELFNSKKDLKRLSIKTSHSKFNEEYEKIGDEIFDLNHFESEGTKKFFSLAGPILDTLNEGKILFIDELDSKLHPLMVKFIVDFFNSEGKNQKNAQLIINTHNTYLLKKDILRRDQIWFVEKNNFGESELYSLDEYKDEMNNRKVRKDESYEKNYLLGKYGAIPHLNEEYFILEEFSTGGEKSGE